MYPYVVDVSNNAKYMYALEGITTRVRVSVIDKEPAPTSFISSTPGLRFLLSFYSLIFEL